MNTWYYRGYCRALEVWVDCCYDNECELSANCKVFKDSSGLCPTECRRTSRERFAVRTPHIKVELLVTSHG